MARTPNRNWQGPLTAAAVAVAALVVLPPASVSAPTGPSTSAASAEEDGAEPSADPAADTPVDISARVAGVHVVSDATERRMRRDIDPKLAERTEEFRACYRTHVAGHSEPDHTVHVDWTVTTDGEPVDITVFTSHPDLEPCIARALRGATFAHPDDRHPRVRVELSFR